MTLLAPLEWNWRATRSKGIKDARGVSDETTSAAATDLNPLLDLRACVRACVRAYALVSLVSLSLFFSHKAHLGKHLFPRT